MMFRCVMTSPFGSPVVPDVNTISAIVSAGMSARQAYGSLARSPLLECAEPARTQSISDRWAETTREAPRRLSRHRLAMATPGASTSFWDVGTDTVISPQPGKRPPTDSAARDGIRRDRSCG